MSKKIPEPVRARARAVAQLAAANPFTDAWTTGERAALGDAFSPRERPWSLGAEADARQRNVEALEALARELSERLRTALDAGVATDEDAALYREVALFDLYSRAIPALDELVQRGAHKKVTAYAPLKAAFERAFAVDARARPTFAAAHWFAGSFQLRRAFHHTFRFFVGASRASARLRGAVWEAIFTADAARFRRALFDRMRDVPTLILGETGTGKELVARAIGLSGFVPFVEDKLAFAGDPAAAFFPLHLAALSPTLVESALFGHQRGAFTGALADRDGVFASCPPWGAVFLDEVGELDDGLQTKLLRVLETRDFTPLGADRPRRFVGRVLAATHRDLGAGVDAGTFRRDVYFRLAGVVVRTPTLRARLAEGDDELGPLVAFLARQVAGDVEGPALAGAARAALARVPSSYPWPGNVRELAQHVRALLVHGALDDAAFVPRSTTAPPATTTAGPMHDDAGDVDDGWLAAARAGALTVDELVTRYVRHVHARVGTYEGTAQRVGLDRRTVKARVG
ncbi:MAG: sigma-54-dependent Fis family transcriptional regulator [Deltaproteobacteria bacterium]|nr:sigma-54-dependent Fis family transcriptional regulator [Deltaproteobacteria bacterium]